MLSFYDPATGQFLSRDPLNALTRSAYGYVYGNPLNNTDPSGLYCMTGVAGHDGNGDEICNGAGDVASNVWRPTRAAATVLNPVTNVLQSATALKASTQGTGCSWDSANWVMVCAGVGNNSHTVGIVVETNLKPCDEFNRERGGGTAAHETKHTDQYAILGGAGFIVFGIGDAIQGTIRQRLDDHPKSTSCYLGTEAWAGFKDGGYDECLT